MWGSQNNMHEPVLAIHGLNDNAASFDQLVPLLDERLHIVCVDLPGHGLSSHFPKGLHFSYLDYVVALKRVVDHLQWSEFSLIAHSLGSHVALYFAAVFNQSVIRISLIDMIFANIIPENRFVVERCQVTLDNLFTIELKKRPYYVFEDCLKKLSEVRQTKLAVKSLIALQKRAFTKTIHGFIQNNDPRVKLLTYPVISSDFHYGLIENIKCPILVISTSEFEPFLSTPATEKSIHELRRKLGSRMRMVHVQGSHDIHMDHPHIIVPHLNKFILNQKCHL